MKWYDRLCVWGIQWFGVRSVLTILDVYVHEILLFFYFCHFVRTFLDAYLRVRISDPHWATFWVTKETAQYVRRAGKQTDIPRIKNVGNLKFSCTFFYSRCKQKYCDLVAKKERIFLASANSFKSLISANKKWWKNWKGDKTTISRCLGCLKEVLTSFTCLKSDGRLSSSSTYAAKDQRP